MEQRGLCGTILSTRRAPAVQVIPGHFIFLSSSPGFDPGIQINNKVNLLTWIAGSSPAMTVLKNSSPLFAKRGTGEALSKNNRCSGCFYLQALCNILASKESVSNRSAPRCLS